MCAIQKLQSSSMWYDTHKDCLMWRISAMNHQILNDKWCKCCNVMECVQSKNCSRVIMWLYDNHKNCNVENFSDDSSKSKVKWVNAAIVHMCQPTILIALYYNIATFESFDLNLMIHRWNSPHIVVVMITISHTMTAIFGLYTWFHIAPFE